MQQFLRRTLFDQHAKSDNCLLEIVHLGIGRQFWFQPRIAADRTAYGGGIAAYVRSDLPCDSKKIREFKNIESICIEILVGNKKWWELVVNFGFSQE
jgi:hypothetical protein